MQIIIEHWINILKTNTIMVSCITDVGTIKDYKQNKRL